MPEQSQNLPIFPPLLAALAIGVALCTSGCGDADQNVAAPPPTTPPALPVPETADAILKQREQLDKSLWLNEVAAQRHEQVFTAMWDEMRRDDDPFAVLAAVPFETLLIGKAGDRASIGDGVGRISADDELIKIDPAEWKRRLQSYRDDGYRIESSEWHHAEFRPDPEAPISLVRFGINAVRSQPAHRVAIDGTLRVQWSNTDPPSMRQLELREWTITDRAAEPAFEEILSAETNAQQTRLLPLIVRDLDGDGLPEIVAGGLNKRWQNLGGGKFKEEPLVPGGLQIFDAGIIADFTGNGRGDLVAVAGDRLPRIWPADEAGRFTKPSRPCAEFTLEFPKAFTAGDIDGDGDLDLFIGQYKFPYSGGAMPTPFYDSKDGHPALLLRNDGDGRFADATESANLGAKRKRRTYSASLFDQDGDGDLDLLTVNDFSGLDLYLNNGAGRFTDTTENAFDERHLFGMAHAFGDFDRDGIADLFAIGMSSTTVGRLDRLGLARDDYPDITTKRLAMTYGNRLYRNEGKRFVHSKHAAQVARTGWAWGTSAADFNLDGTLDLYIANGHSSGKTSTDYCTQYWRHDVYTGSSKPNLEVSKALGSSLAALNAGEISWNGFEKNALFTGHPDDGFTNVAHPLGVAFEADSRGVVATDIDADGRPDLLLATVKILGGGRNHYSLKVFRNTLATSGRHWIGLRLKPGSIGATVVVKSGGTNRAKPIVTGDSFSSQHPLVAHFGLGEDSDPVEVEIRWPGGERSVLKDLETDRYHEVTR